MVEYKAHHKVGTNAVSTGLLCWPAKQVSPPALQTASIQVNMFSWVNMEFFIAAGNYCGFNQRQNLLLFLKHRQMRRVGPVSGLLYFPKQEFPRPHIHLVFPQHMLILENTLQRPHVCVHTPKTQQKV